jgi:hypothetical protein
MEIEMEIYEFHLLGNVIHGLFQPLLPPFSMLYRVEFGVKYGKCTHPYMRNVYF